LYRDEDKVLYLKVLVKLIIRQYEFNLWHHSFLL
jgi:hypothetical protein